MQLSRDVLCSRQYVEQIGLLHQPCQVSALTWGRTEHGWSNPRFAHDWRFVYANAGIAFSPQSFRDVTYEWKSMTSPCTKAAQGLSAHRSAVTMARFLLGSQPAVMTWPLGVRHA